jgi:hypothetical protein
MQRCTLLHRQVDGVGDVVEQRGWCGSSAAAGGVADDLMLGGQCRFGGQFPVPVPPIHRLPVAAAQQAGPPGHQRGRRQYPQPRGGGVDRPRGQPLHPPPVGANRVAGVDVQDATQRQFEVVDAEHRPLRGDVRDGLRHGQVLVVAYRRVEHGRQVLLVDNAQLFGRRGDLGLAEHTARRSGMVQMSSHTFAICS